MPYDYLVDQERGFLWVRYSGMVSVAERRAAAEHVLGEVTGPEARRVLLDYRQATSLSTDETSSTALAAVRIRTRFASASATSAASRRRPDC